MYLHLVGFAKRPEEFDRRQHLRELIDYVACVTLPPSSSASWRDLRLVVCTYERCGELKGDYPVVQPTYFVYRIGHDVVEGVYRMKPQQMASELLNETVWDPDGDRHS